MSESLRVAPLRLEVGPTYRQLCDASGVTFLSDDTFVAASDEARKSDGQNRLQIYRVGTAQPVGQFDLNESLKLDKDDDSEVDIESATRIGSTIYWISSHGRDSDAKEHPNRQRFFATRFHNGQLEPEGKACSNLLQSLVEGNDELKSAFKAHLAPEEGGISIEGLCQGKGETLWVGFRSPLAYSRALCCEISNPADVMRGKTLKMGGFWTLNLGERGIRDWTRYGKKWLILAGSAQDKDDFALYEWSGDKNTQPKLLGDLTQALKTVGLEGMHPEALAVSPQGQIWLMSDDGGLRFPDGKNKKLPDEKRTFRSVRVFLDQASTR